jgi:hypothetical protein
LVSGALKIDEDWEGEMGEEEEEEDGDSEGGREADYSSMLSVHITEQVNLPGKCIVVCGLFCGLGC